MLLLDKQQRPAWIAAIYPHSNGCRHGNLLIHMDGVQIIAMVRKLLNVAAGIGLSVFMSRHRKIRWPELAREVSSNSKKLFKLTKESIVNKTVQQLIFGVLAISAVSAAFAADPKPEDEIRYRQSALNVIGRNFGVLGAIAKGERPYDQALAVKTATLLELLGPLPFGSFGPGTDKGAVHKADPKVWSEPAKFKEAADKLQFELAKLPEAAKDLDTLKLQVGATGKACKACHDDFRVKAKP